MLGVLSAPKDKMAGRTATGTRAVALSLALVFGLTACGDDYVARDQPQIGGLRFEKITFADVPRPPNAELKTSGRADGVDTELRSIPGTSPKIVVEYYEEKLAEAGWTVKNEPGEINGSGEWAGTWTQQGHDLVVDARFGDADDEGVVATDYTLAMS